MQNLRSIISVVVGGLLIALATLELLAIPELTRFQGYVDFPCPDEQSMPDIIPASTKIAYCISWFPRGFSGGGIYVVGDSDEEHVVMPKRPILPFWYGDLVLEKRGQNLVVNGRLLLPGRKYWQLNVFPTVNPWLLLSASLTVVNHGYDNRWSSMATDAIYVFGDLREGWLPNPLGMIILGTGIWLLVRGIRKTRHARNKNEAV